MASYQTAVQNAVQRPQNNADMLGGLSQFTSLDTPQNMSLGATVADIGMGFLPFVGTAQGMRDFERARRDDDMLGMALGGLSAIPFAGGIVKAGRAVEGAMDVAQAGKAASEITAQGRKINIRKPSDNINNVMSANFQYPKVIGNQIISINDVSGGVRLADPSERRRVANLAAKISDENGYISRIIVDQNNNVIEGQHRLEALREIGADNVPVYKIEELADTMPVLQMENAMNAVGMIHPDHVNQLMQHALDNIAEYGIDGARNLDFGRFQKYYDAALDVASKGG
jgi:hypothetical protein